MLASPQQFVLRYQKMSNMFTWRIEYGDKKIQQNVVNLTTKCHNLNYPVFFEVIFMKPSGVG